MFTDKRIVQVPYWCHVIEHAHTVRPRVSEDGEKLLADIEDGCTAYLYTWDDGHRMAITPCGEVVYFSVRADGDVEKSVMIKRGRVANEGAK